MKDECLKLNIGTRKISGIFHHFDSGKSPIIIMCHGYGSEKNREKYIKLAELLSKEKIASFRFDFFGHGKSDGKFEDFTASKGLEDVQNVYKYVVNSEFIDSTRIGIFGSSMGGFISILAASEFDKFNFKAMVLSAPAIDYNDINKNAVELRRFHEDAKKYDLYKKAGWIKCPILIIHGRKDDTVPVKQSERFFELLNSDIEKKLKIIEDATHYFQGHQIDEVVNLSIDWFRRWLK